MQLLQWSLFSVISYLVRVEMEVEVLWDELILYLNIRYGESFSRVGSLELFLKWNREDPVSEFEEQRNDVIYAAQGNRNAFIDNPYLATLIYGGTYAANTWE